jgi:hypothetical protein
MATRRKYRGPPAFREGGRVPIDDVIVVASPEAATAPPEHAAMPPDHQMPDDRGPLGRALDAQQRAEDLQREAHQASPAERHINSIPGLTDHKRAFLRANPDLLHADVAPLVARAHQAALHAGIEDDTEAMNRHVMDEVVRSIEQHRELTSARARPTEENRTIHESAADLGRMAEQYLAEYQDEHAPAAAPAVAPRRSIPYSAPVSRESPTMSGQPRQTSQNTLSPDERFIARESFPHLSKGQAEYEYFKNKS